MPSFRITVTRSRRITERATLDLTGNDTEALKRLVEHAMPHLMFQRVSADEWSQPKIEWVEQVKEDLL
jgi:hypothetical protein